MSETKTLKLKAEKVVALIGGLQALGGYDRIVKDGTNEKAIHESYKFGAGLRRIIGRNIAALTKSNADTVAAQRALIAECSNDAGILDKASEARYNSELLHLIEAEDDVDLTTISIAEMKLDENPVPGPTLGILDDILED